MVCCYWNFGARQDHRGSLEDHTSWSPCFFLDGPTRSLPKCWGLDRTDEECVWNEGWPENQQQPALVTYRPIRKPLLTACQPPLSLLGVGTEVAEPDNVPLAACHLQSRFQFYLVDGRLRVRLLPGEHFQQRCQAYRVQASSGSVHVLGVFSVVPNRLLCSPTDTSPVVSTGAFCGTP